MNITVRSLKPLDRCNKINASRIILLIIAIDIKVHQRVIFIVKETRKKMIEILHPLEEEILSTNKHRVDLK